MLKEYIFIVAFLDGYHNCSPTMSLGFSDDFYISSYETRFLIFDDLIMILKEDF